MITGAPKWNAVEWARLTGLRLGLSSGVVVDSGDGVTHHFAGHIETGRSSKTDPHIGRG